MAKQDKTVRIGGASGFWGDSMLGAPQLVNSGQIDYLVFDYLAETTMAILAAARAKNPELGYATDFVDIAMKPVLAEVKRQGIKVVSNAGGINPLGCGEALKKLISDAGLDLKVAVVVGDNLSDRQQEFREQGLPEMFSGAAMPAKLASMNAYLGAVAIRDALAAGADIVVTGRCVDSAVVVGPLLHEFGWSLDDYDKLAQASLAGHIIECGAQCCGGNFTDWDSVPGYDNMGFPIAEVFPDSTFTISKPAGTGGLISTATIAEQIVYEIGDPQAYLLPDVTADFSHTRLEQIAENVVRVSGARGTAPTDSYKVSATWPDGYRTIVSFMIGGIDAARKGERVANAILTKCERVLALRGAPGFTAKDVEIIGTETTYGAHARHRDTREVVVKIAVTHPFKEALLFFASEIAQASTGMAPGLAGIFGGRPKPSDVVKLFSVLVKKTAVPVEVDINGQRLRVEVPAGSSAPLPTPLPAGPAAALAGDEVEVPLVQLAWCRSGDKGNASNIGVIARRPEYLPYIRASVNEQSVRAWMAHVLDGDNSVVTRYELPGFNALNFLMTNALGGGGIASLRIDPQGKALGQQLLEIPVKVPAGLIK